MLSAHHGAFGLDARGRNLDDGHPAHRRATCCPGPFLQKRSGKRPTTAPNGLRGATTRTASRSRAPRPTTGSSQGRRHGAPRRRYGRRRAAGRGRQRGSEFRARGRWPTRLRSAWRLRRTRRRATRAGRDPRHGEHQRGGHRRHRRRHADVDRRHGPVGGPARSRLPRRIGSCTSALTFAHPVVEPNPAPRTGVVVVVADSLALGSRTG